MKNILETLTNQQSNSKKDFLVPTNSLVILINKLLERNGREEMKEKLVILNDVVK
jgi:hypothetical protein